MYDFHSGLHGCDPCKNSEFVGPCMMLDAKVTKMREMVC